MTPELEKAVQFAMSDIYSNPPEEYKHNVIRAYAKSYECSILIETGTNKGDTVEAVKNDFSRIHSIELGPRLYRETSERFKQDLRVCLCCGDSIECVPAILAEIPKEYRILFYLDAHSRYDDTSPQGHGVGTSAPQEVEIIAKLRPDSIILIDDARLFVQQYNTDWPRLDDFIQKLESYNLWNILLEKDIIRLVPLAF